MSRHEKRIKKLERRRARRAATEEEVPDDPVAFAESLGIVPDPWQRDLLASKDKRIILNCARQSGKSTVVAILGLHHALTVPDALVLILSPSLRQSELLLEKVSTFYRRLDRPGGSDTDSATTLKLRNGSRIAALPGSESTTRGFTPSLVLLDEAARVSEELYYSDVRPMLAVSRGQLILLSTPHGKQGIFWHAWDEEPDWKKVKVTADQCPRIDKDFLEQERRALGEWRFAQEYCCEFVQDEDSIIKEHWIQYYDPADVPYMDKVIQSWDTAQTKSSSSSFVVGQVWGCIGADFYLLDQVRGRLDFDETVRAVKALSKRWPRSTAILVEAQALGAALVTHLKHDIPGLIPITVKGSKETRAYDCLPLWQSKNVYIPKPDNGEYAWVYEYVQELLNFPNAAYDDQVDATTLALNQLHDTLFRASKVRVIAATSQPLTPSQPLQGHYYFVGWVPGRSLFTVLVFDYTDYTDYKVVSFGRYSVESIEDQITGVARVARYYNNAAVRAFDDRNEALVSALEARGVYVERVAGSERKSCYDNLALLMENDTIAVPAYPELKAELDVFKSAPTYDESADYGLQVAQQSAIDALCLVTHDLTPGLIRYLTQPSVYYGFDPDLFNRRDF